MLANAPFNHDDPAERDSIVHIIEFLKGIATELERDTPKQSFAALVVNVRRAYAAQGGTPANIKDACQAVFKEGGQSRKHFCTRAGLVDAV
jgi:hypothetical protein